MSLEMTTSICIFFLRQLCILCSSSAKRRFPDRTSASTQAWAEPLNLHKRKRRETFPPKATVTTNVSPSTALIIHTHGNECTMRSHCGRNNDLFRRTPRYQLGRIRFQSGRRYLHWIQTRYMVNWRPRFTSNRRSTRFCSSTSPTPSNKSRSSSVTNTDTDRSW